MPRDMVEKNNQSRKFVGGFARDFQEGFQGMLYYVVICRNQFYFIKWLGVYVECICCGSSLFLDQWGFQPRRRFWTCRNLTSTAKKKSTPNLTQMAKLSRKQSSPQAPSTWQDQAKEEASLNTQFCIILIHSLLLHFLTMVTAQNCDLGEYQPFFMVPKDIGHHSLPRYASLFSFIFGCLCHFLPSLSLNSKAHLKGNQDVGLCNYYL